MRCKDTFLVIVLSFGFTLSLFAQHEDRLPCGVNDELSPETIESMQQAHEAVKKGKMAAIDQEDPYFCVVSVDVDYETYTAFDKDFPRIKHELLTMIDKVSQIYERDAGIRIVLGDIHVWDDPETDPYKGETDIFKLLTTFRKVSKRKDIFPGMANFKMYLPIKNLVGAGGVASVDINVSPWGNEMVIAHELGHNFGSPHTQSCRWPEGPLDHCYPAEGSCYANALENNVGTIMSYCNSVNVAFHPLIRSLLGFYSQSKLTRAESVPDAPILTNGPEWYADSPLIEWEGGPNASGYWVRLASDPGFSNIVYQDTLRVPSLLYDGFELNKTYYLEIFAMNARGLSKKSETQKIIVDDFKALQARVLKPSESIGVEYIAEFDMEYTEVEGADEYEIEISYGNPNYAYVYRYKQNFISQTTSVKVESSRISIYDAELRVRGIKNGIAGSWSRNYNLRPNILREDLGTKPLVMVKNSVGLKFNEQKNWPNKLKAGIFRKNQFNAYELMEEREFHHDKYESLGQIVLFDSLETGAEYRVSLSLEDYPRFPLEKKIEMTESYDFVMKNGFKGIDVEYINTYPADAIEMVKVKGEYLYGKSERGLVRKHLNSSEIKIFNFEEDPEKSISNSLKAYDITNSGDIWTIQPIAKRPEEYDVYPPLIYAMNHYNSNGKLLEQRSISSWPGAYEDTGISWFDAESQLIIGEYGLYSPDTATGGIEVFVPKEGYFFRHMADNDEFVWILTGHFFKDFTLYRVNKKTKNFETYTLKYAPTTPYWLADRVYSGTMDKTNRLWVIGSEGEVSVSGDDGKFHVHDLDGINIFSAYDIFSDNQGNPIIKCSGNTVPNTFFIRYLYGRWVHMLTYGEPAYSSEYIYPTNDGGLVHDIKEVPSKWKFFCNATENLEANLPKYVLTGDTVFFAAKGCDLGTWKVGAEKFDNQGELVLTEDTDYSFVCNKNIQLNCLPTKLEGNIKVLSSIDIETNTIYVCKDKSVSVDSHLEGLSRKGLIQVKLVSSDNEWQLPVDLEDGLLKFDLPENMRLGEYEVSFSSDHLKFNSQGKLVVIVQAVPEVEVVGKNFSCDGSAVTIKAESEVSDDLNFVWKGENGEELGTNASFVASQSGIYSLYAVNKGGCKSQSGPVSVSVENFSELALEVENEGYMFPEETMPLLLSGVHSEKYSTSVIKDGQFGTSNELAVSQSGTYAVSVKSEFCEATTNEVIVTILEGNRIYPNPSSGEMKLYMEADGNLKVYNNSGRLFYSKQLPKGRHSISVKSWPIGLYLVKFVNNKRMEVKKAIVK